MRKSFYNKRKVICKSPIKYDINFMVGKTFTCPVTKICLLFSFPPEKKLPKWKIFGMNKLKTKDIFSVEHQIKMTSENICNNLVFNKMMKEIILLNVCLFFLSQCFFSCSEFLEWNIYLFCLFPKYWSNYITFCGWQMTFSVHFSFQVPISSTI